MSRPLRANIGTVVRRASAAIDGMCSGGHGSSKKRYFSAWSRLPISIALAAALTFLWVAYKGGFEVTAYEDEAVGVANDSRYGLAVMPLFALAGAGWWGYSLLRRFVSGLDYIAIDSPADVLAALTNRQ